MQKILIADDEKHQEELTMQRFANKDYLREYEFLFARDGFQAFQLIKDHEDIDMVFYQHTLNVLNQIACL